MPQHAAAAPQSPILGESRLERAANELQNIRKKKQQLEEEEEVLKRRILLMVRTEGTADEKGKIRFETEQNKFLIVSSQNTYADPYKLPIALLGIGLTPEKVKTVTEMVIKVTPYEFVRVDPKLKAVK